jgi:hypothetical protein|tara:strand:+ start:1394 stop:1630 length:237 start_codon:yes stop_codon:yes gene_type:complete
MTEKKWINKIEKLLLNKKIVKVSYMNQKETDEMGWNQRAVMFQLDSGEWIYPSMDDEGNDAGALFTTDQDLPVIPVFN